MKLEVYFNDGSEMIEIPVTSEDMAGEEVSKMLAAGGAMMERPDGWTFKPMTTVLRFKFTNTPPEPEAESDPPTEE